MAQKRPYPASSSADDTLRPSTVAASRSSSSGYVVDSASTTTSTLTATTDKTYKSAAVHDRNSKFVGLFSSSQHHMLNPRLLQKTPEFADADHRILAYRRPSKQRTLTSTTTTNSVDSASSRHRPDQQKTVYETYSDDDGEKYAGKKLEKVLNDLNVLGVVVVARWWGGVMLGPARFTHIENCAKEAVRRSLGNGSYDDNQDDREVAKRPKLDHEDSRNPDPQNDEKQREKLAKILQDRDDSISVLRGLLHEKNEVLKRSTVETSPKNVDNITTTGDSKGNMQTEGDPQESSSSAGATMEPSLERDGHRHDRDTKNESSTSDRPGSDDDIIDDHQKDQERRNTPSSSSSSPAAALPNSNRGAKSDIALNDHNEAAPPTTKPQKPSPYQNLPLSRLKQLEKAKDATLSWILKQIDTVEEQIRERENPDPFLTCHDVHDVNVM